MIKQVLVVRKDLNMRKGKMASQCAHASLKVFLDRMNFGGLDDSGSLSSPAQAFFFAGSPTR